MTLLFMTGKDFNQLGLGTVTSNTPFHSLFPLTNAYDNRPAKPAVTVDTSYIGNGLTITCDGNHKFNTNGGFESSSSGWLSIATATVTITTSSGNPHSGSRAMAFVATSSNADGTAYWATNLEVPSGSQWTIEAYLAGLPLSLGVWVENLETGRYWNGAQWVISAGATGQPVTYGISSSTAYTRKATTFTVQSYAETGLPTSRLRIGARRFPSGGPTGTGYVDDFAIWPTTNFFSAHGHNFPHLDSTDQAALIAEGSSDNFTTNNRLGTLSQGLESSYIYVAESSATVYRYVRIRAGLLMVYGGSTGQLYDSSLRFGEVVFSQARTFGQEPLHEAITPWKVSYTQPQTRGTNIGGGTVSAYPYTVNSNRTVSIPYRLNSSTDYDDFVNDILRRSLQGVYPIVIVPDSAKSDIIYGRISTEQSFDNFHVDAYDSTLQIVEEAGPVFMTTG